MDQQKGFIHLLPVIVVLVLAIAAVILLGSGVVKLPSSLTNLLTKKQEPTVEVKEDYKNPFDKEAQYVNPFDQYKSPFLTLQEEKR